VKSTVVGNKDMSLDKTKHIEGKSIETALFIGIPGTIWIVQK
jgi:hypothetical protein